MYDLDIESLATGDQCQIAKRAWNQAHIFKMLFITLTLVLGVAVLAALVYAFLAFDDAATARGWLALVTAVATGSGAIYLGKLAIYAKKDEDDMYKRVGDAC